MEKRGSITLFLTLMLSLLLSLVSTSIQSVQMAAARTQILNGMDIGLYSLFGQYDKNLLEKYELFAVDGSFGGGSLDMAGVYDNLEFYMKPVLKQNSQKLSVKQGGFSGYRLLTDEDGEIFYSQIVSYMQETLGSQGIQLLLDRMSDRDRKTQEADQKANEVENKGSLSQYDSEMNQASSKSQQAAEEAAKRQEEQGGDFQAPSPDFQSPSSEPVKNPITVIKRIMKMGVLELVLPSGKGISTAQIEKGNLVSVRELQKGMQMPDGFLPDESYSGAVLFQQYLISKLGNYTKPSKNSLAYQMEYIYAGKNSDLDNLKSVASRLLFLREGVNFACLLGDSVKRSQAQALATAIAAGFLIPPAATVIESALLLCWAFAESILDVRELFDGGKIPLVKTGEEWQISLENLPELMNGLDSMRKKHEQGMNYEDYLQVLLLSSKRGQKIWRSMDMIEDTIRKSDGRPAFCLDSCITAIEASVDVEANRRKTFHVTRQYCYE